MFARDPAERAADTARLLAGQLPTPLVPDTDQRPYAMVPGSQLIKQLVHDYVAAVIDDRPLAEATKNIAGRTEIEWLPPRTYTRPDAGALQVATLMARTRSPLVAVERDGDQGRLVGALTAARLMERLIGEM
ncbi:hypothetical protein [Streptomyces sp. NBC_00316]|uniref:hypothetical protein n=1 Tax=Streptomyces sp. NBC_00316 TaxID=2975710 RepID=UPI002E2AAFD1|nr:hypothetical protein [Streptomyces sp. NBC_00316]